MSVTADTEELTTALLSQAAERLQKDGDVYPFAGYMKADREIFVLHPPPEESITEIKPLVDGLAHQLRLALLEESVLATAIVCKARVKLPEQKTGETEALCVTLDHRDGPAPDCQTPFEAYFPFSVSVNGVIAIDPPVLGECELAIFPKNRN
jgi:hypothetical protein